MKGIVMQFAYDLRSYAFAYTLCTAVLGFCLPKMHRIHSDRDRGTVRLGRYSGEADNPDLRGRDTLSCGSELITSGSGSATFGSSETPGGARTSGVGSLSAVRVFDTSTAENQSSTTFLAAIAANNSSAIAKGDTSNVQLKATRESSVEGTFAASNGSLTADSNSSVTASASSSSVIVTASASGVATVNCASSFAAVDADGGLAELESQKSVSLTKVLQYGVLKFQNTLGQLKALVGGKMNSHGQFRGEAVLSEVIVNLDGGDSEVHAVRSNVTLSGTDSVQQCSAADSVIVASALPTTKTEGTYSNSFANIQNVSETSNYGLSLGFGGSNVSLLPSVSLYAGASSQAPALQLRVESSGTAPTSTGRATAWQATGTGIKEMFFWADGNPLAESRLGLFVGLQSDRIVEASDSVDVIGVTSWKRAGLITGCLEGAQCAQTHEGVPVFKKDYTVSVNQQLQLHTKPQLPYGSVTTAAEAAEILKGADIAEEPTETLLTNAAPVSSEEGEAVTLLGRVIVYDDGKCEKLGSCDCKNGKAVPGSRWKILRRVSYQTVEILFR